MNPASFSKLFKGKLVWSKSRSEFGIYIRKFNGNCLVNFDNSVKGFIMAEKKAIELSIQDLEC